MKNYSPLHQLSFWIIDHMGTVESVVLHTVFFIIALIPAWLGFQTDRIMLILTTVVSLEAIYLTIFLQMTVKHQDKRLISKLSGIQEDVEELTEEENDEALEEVIKLLEQLRKKHNGNGIHKVDTAG